MCPFCTLPLSDRELLFTAAPWSLGMSNLYTQKVRHQVRSFIATCQRDLFLIEITSYAHASKLNCEKLCCGGEHPGVEEGAPDAKTYDGGAPVPDHG